MSPTTGEAAEDSVRPIVAGDSVIGTLKVGSYFNEAAAEELKRRTGLDIVFVSRGKVTASTLGKDVSVNVPPEAIQAATAAPSTAEFSIRDTAAQAQIVYLPSDVGDGMTVAFVSSLNEVDAAKRSFAW